MPLPLADAEMETRRAALQRELRHAQFAGKGVLAFTFALAIVAVWLAHHSFQQTQKEAEASLHLIAEQRRVEEALWQSQVNHARAVLEIGKLGARTEALQIIRLAAQRRASPELRDSAIAALFLADLGAEETFRGFAAEGSGFDQQDPTRLSVDPTLKYITRSHGDGSVQCARFADGQIIWELRGPGKPVHGPVVWSPDSEYLAVQHGDRLSVHHLKTQRMAFATPCFESAGLHTAVAFSPDSRKLFAWVDGFGILYELSTGKEIARLPRFEKLYHVAFHPKRPWVSLITGNVIEIWDYTTLRRVTSLSPDERDFHFNHHAWSDDGLSMAAAGNDNYVVVWDATTFQHPVIRHHSLIGHSQPVVYVAFNHAADTLVSCSMDGETRWWNPHAWSGETLRRLSHGYGVQFGPDDQTLAFLRPSQGVSLRSVANHPSMQRLAGPVGYAAPLNDAQFSADGRWIAGVNGDGLFVWDAAVNRVVARGAAYSARSVVFRPSGGEIITSSSTGVLRWPWNVTTNTDGTVTCQLGQPALLPLPNRAEPVKAVLSREGTRLLVGAQKNQAFLFDLNQDTPPVALSGQSGLDTLAFSPDGTRVATGTRGGEQVRIWDAATGKTLHQIPSLDADVDYTLDGRWLVFSKVAGYSFWHTSSNSVLKSFPREEGEQNSGHLTFLPNGRTVAWTQSFNRVQLVEIESLRILATFTVPGDRKIEWLRTSPDGRWLAVFASRVYLYDLEMLQRELGALGLDWQKREAPVAATPALDIPAGQRNSPRFLAGVGTVSGTLVTLILGGLLLALALGGLTQRYHRRLLASYFELETMATRRHEALLRAQDDLQHSHKMRALGTLAAGIAHDFNNLLSIIRLSNQLTARAAKTNPEIQENSADIEKAVAQGKGVVRSMLGYSRETADDGQPYSLAELVESIVGLLGKQFLSGITLTLELEPDLPPVSVSKARVEQILLNLIVNASEAMAGQGKLLLSAHPVATAHGTFALPPRNAPCYVEVLVADSGPGIPPDALPRIFEPFFTTKKIGATRGTGLGLSMVYTVAREEGLGIRVESAPGEGTAFHILIPVEGIKV